MTGPATRSEVMATSDTPVYQNLIAGKSMSGRGVRYRELTSEEIDQVALDAVRQMSAGDLGMRLQQIEIREGMLTFLVSVTKRAGLDAEALAKLPDSEWEPVNKQKLEMDGTYSFNKLFARAKDRAMLARLYQDLNVVTEAEVKDITGKACMVACEAEAPAGGPGTGTGG